MSNTATLKNYSTRFINKKRGVFFFLNEVKKSFGLLFFLTLLICSLSSFGQTSSINAPNTLAQMYCGSCHVAPSPNDLPKEIWKKTILPEMGSYYGIQKDGFGLLKKMKAEELKAIKSLKIHPETQQISDETWQLIKNYFINNAPEEITKPKDRKKRTKNLKSFKRKNFDLLGLPESLISSLVFDDSKNELWVVEDRNMAYSWTLKKGVQDNVLTTSVVSHIAVKSDSIFLLEMGSLIPTQFENGSLSLVYNHEKKTLIEKLHRPVHFNVDDKKPSFLL